MTDSPIERYLDQLFAAARTSAPREARSLLEETEAHLRDAADEAVRSGMTLLDAETAAVARFGDAGTLAVDDRTRHSARLLTRIVISAWMLGAIGAIAVGTTGAIAGGMRLIGLSPRLLAGSPVTSELTGVNCARWLAIYPHQDCAGAATMDWANETVFYRIAFGVLGMLAIGVLCAARRRWPGLRFATLPRIVVDTVATVSFTAAGIWLVGMTIDAFAHAGVGFGQWLSAAPIALGGGAFFGLRLAREVRCPQGPPTRFPVAPS